MLSMVYLSADAFRVAALAAMINSHTVKLEAEDKRKQNPSHIGSIIQERRRYGHTGHHRPPLPTQEMWIVDPPPDDDFFLSAALRFLMSAKLISWVAPAAE